MAKRTEVQFAVVTNDQGDYLAVKVLEALLPSAKDLVGQFVHTASRINPDLGPRASLIEAAATKTGIEIDPDMDDVVCKDITWEIPENDEILHGNAYSAKAVGGKLKEKAVAKSKETVVAPVWIPADEIRSSLLNFNGKEQPIVLEYLRNRGTKDSS